MGWSAIATQRTTQTGSYQSQVATAVNTAADQDTGTIDAALNWSAVRDGQAFYVIRAGAVIACRCIRSVSTTRLTYYRLYTDDGIEIPTTVQIGDTITLCEDAITVGSGTTLGAVVGITLTTTGAGSQIFRLYAVGDNALNIGGYFQFRHTDLVLFGTAAPDKTVRIDAGGFCVIGAYFTVKGVTRYERDILLRGTKAHSNNSSVANAFLSNDTATSRMDWFGGTIEAGGCLGEFVTGATVVIYSKAATFRGLGQVGGQNYQWRPGGVVTVYGVSVELSETFTVANPAAFSGFQEIHCRMAFATSSATPSNTWITIKGASVVGGNSQTDVGAFATKWFRFINQRTGSAFVYQGNVPSATTSNNGLCEIRQEVSATVTNISGSGISGRIFCRDKNNGSRKAANLWGTSPDYVADRTYESAVTGGSASFTADGGVLVAVYSQDAGFNNLPTDRLNFDYRGLDNSSTDRFAFGLAAYGFEPATTTVVLKGTSAYALAYTMLADAGVTASSATAATYTDRFSIDGSGNITVTNNATLDELYDYAQSWLQASGANMELAGLGSKLVSYSGAGLSLTKNVTINGGATLSSGSKFRTITTTGTLTITGSMAVQAYTSPAGTFVQLGATNLVAGSRYQFYNVTDATEISNATAAGTSVSQYVQYTTDKTIRLRLAYQSGTNARAQWSGTGIISASGLSFLAAQINDDVYIANAIDGSGVTEFTPDYPNVQIDVSDPDNLTTVQRLYAWYVAQVTTSSGINNFFGGIIAEDAVNYRIAVSIVNLKLDNTSASPVIIGGARLYRDDNSTVIATTSGSIQMDPNKAYVAGGGFGDVSESGQTYGKQFRDMRAVLLGKTTGGGTTTETFLAADGTTTRVTSINDGVNRTSVVVPGA